MLPAYRNTKQNTSGFTLVELIVALGLFAVVSTISIGSLITLMDNNRQLRDDQAVIANIGFAFDMMTRDIRQGVDYYCQTYPMPASAGSPGNRFSNQNAWSANRRDCENGFTETANFAAHGVSFRTPESLIEGSIERVAYYYDRDEGTIMRRREDKSPESIISDTLTVLDADFVVTDTAAGDDEQPTVTIFVKVRAGDGKEYSLQSTVTQRLLDI